MKVAALLFALLAGAAQAETTVGLHLGSQHFPARYYNNVNPGLYVRHDGWTAGAYLNSYKRWSTYAGYTWDTDYHGFNFAVTAGVATGYLKGRCYEGSQLARKPDCHATLRPLLIPSIATPGLAGWRPRIAVLPGFEKNGASVIHFMLEKQL